MAKRFFIDENSKAVIQDMRDSVVEARQIRGRNGVNPSAARPIVGRGASIIGLVQLTAAGADSSHWKWMFALRKAADGKFMAGKMGSDEIGECAIANAGKAAVGTKGILYYQQGDDDAVSLVLVPLSTRYTPTNPKDLTFAGSHAEAAGQTYDAAFNLIDTSLPDAGYDGVKVSRLLDAAYYDPGDKKVYGYRVDELYDLEGRLVSRGAAYRVMIFDTCAPGS